MAGSMLFQVWSPSPRGKACSLSLWDACRTPPFADMSPLKARESDRFLGEMPAPCSAEDSSPDSPLTEKYSSASTFKLPPSFSTPSGGTTSCCTSSPSDDEAADARRRRLLLGVRLPLLWDSGESLPSSAALCCSRRLSASACSSSGCSNTSLMIPTNLCSRCRRWLFCWPPENSVLADDCAEMSHCSWVWAALLNLSNIEMVSRTVG
mmetsp:Transcript_72218/g.182062  ORF Transcript_72218/g.182062 Transcript_72218/m.182062 type:complete len:208 (+) Transcript_72218:639-1262(+)